MSRALTLVAIATAIAPAIAMAAPTYNDNVRPLLSANCFKCHGPDDAERKGDTRLDVAGEADLDEVIARITSTDPDEIMPPPEANKTLTGEQIETLKAWIDNGANYERHWAFVPPSKPEVPPDRHPIDHLGETGNAPAADPYTLIRRLHLDLIGLPPTPAEADAFAADPSDAAYREVVDRLLASPRYGERWARRWLDLARYADTNGYEKDRDRSIWPYRDWVVRALNDDLPFDRFTVEQIAGDMLPGATPDQLVATGFHRNTMLNEEGGIDPLEFRFHAMTDRVATTGTTWLGLTTGCAQCHTHKYDPITHHDYFGMMAYLNNADEPDYRILDEAALAKHRADLAEADRLEAGLASKWPVAAGAPRFTTLTPSAVRTAGGSVATIAADGTVSIGGPSPATDTYTVELEGVPGAVTALRLEAVARDGRGPGRTPHGNFVLSEIEITASAPGGEPQPVRIAGAVADIEQPGFPVAKAIDGNLSGGWGAHHPDHPLGTDRAATFQFAEPVSLGEGGKLAVRLVQELGRQHTIASFRIALGSPAANSPRPSRDQALNEAFAAWLERERRAVVDWRVLEPTELDANVPYLVDEGDGVVFVGGDTSKHDIYRLSLAPSDRPVAALRLEALPDDRLPDRGPGTTFYEGRKGDFYLTEFNVAGREVASATETYAKNRFGNNPVSARLASDGDIQTGWSVAGRIGERHVAVFVLDEPIPAGEPVALEMHFGRHYASSLGKFRISATDRPDAVATERDSETDRLLAKSPLGAADREALLRRFLLQAPELAKHAERIARLRQPPAGDLTLVLRERPAGFPRPTYLHHRGEFTQPEEQVPPRLPDAIYPEGEPLPENRLEFARWLVSDHNPLTPRVVANRHWAAFFGTGIVPTLEDFGMQGALPTEPELLDHLALFLRDEAGWSLKKLHHHIVTSARYRAAAFPRQRLEAEVIRDSALGAAGVLNEKMFGPPVRPPQPAGVTEVAYGAPKWNPSGGGERFRRSLYTYQKRTAPFAMFTTFDAGSGEACIARRDRSNTPLQALTLMNDPMFIEIAERFGESLAALEGDDRSKLATAFRRVLTRPPNPGELAALEAFHRKHQSWAAVARALLSLDEAVTKA